MEKLEESAFDQATLIRLLRVRLGKTVPASVLAAVRDVRWSRVAHDEQDVQHTQHTLGKTVELTVSGANQLFEEFSITSAVYAHELAESTCSIRVALDLDHAKQQFRLAVMEDGVQRAMQSIQQELHERLEELVQESEKIDVYYGTP